MIKLVYGMIPFNTGDKPQAPDERGRHCGHLNPELIINLQTQGRSILAECVGGRTIKVYQVQVNDKGEHEEKADDVKLNLLVQLYDHRRTEMMNILRRIDAGVNMPVITSVSDAEGKVDIVPPSIPVKDEEPVAPVKTEEKPKPKPKARRQTKRRTTRKPKK